MTEASSAANRDSAYQQLDLQRRQIRILRLLPGSGGEPVNCTLLTAYLDDDPSYEALSYVWGDPILCEPIVVDGHARQVTINLAAALNSLRHLGIARDLWTDALCIN